MFLNSDTSWAWYLHNCNWSQMTNGYKNETQNMVTNVYLTIQSSFALDND